MSSTNMDMISAKKNLYRFCYVSFRAILRKTKKTAIGQKSNAH